MEFLGLYSNHEVEELMGETSVIYACKEGTLLDSLLFYNPDTEKYYACLEYGLNEWSSGLQVYSEGGSGIEVLKMWENIAA